MSDSSEKPLNGQQMAEVAKRLEGMIVGLRNDVELRKLALRHACDMHGEKPGDVVKLAEQMHAFLTAGTKT